MALLRTLRRTNVLYAQAGRLFSLTSQNNAFVNVRPPSFQRLYSTNVKVSTDLIKKLRAETDAPLGQCKKALEESGADIDQAKEWLRRKGLQTAQSKSSRTAVEGLVGVLTDPQKQVGVIVEINCETDFVMRNEQFQSVVSRVTKATLDHVLQTREEGDLDINKLKDEIKVDGKSVAAAVAELAGIIRENIQLRRISVLRTKNDQNVIAPYVHNTKADNLGAIGALVEIAPALEDKANKDDLQRFGREVAMHIVGMEPKYLKKEEVPESVIEYERQIAREKAIRDGKAQDVLDKIVDGQIKKYYTQVTLNDQPWIMDQKQSVDKICKSANARVESFLRLKCGDQSK
jgi:elongation factor Ts